MKIFFWTLLLPNIVLMGCSEQRVKTTPSSNTEFILEVPEKIVLRSVLQYNPKISLWTLNGLPYSGFVISYYSDNTLREKFAILDGKKQNEAIQWYPDGHLKITANYHKGKLHGEKKIWSADSVHILIAHFNYQTGKAHGEQKKWYPSGELFKKLNMYRGKEEGIQQAYRRNGALYANYEVRKGRIFGLKKAALCYGLEEEKVRYKR